MVEQKAGIFLRSVLRACVTGVSLAALAIVLPVSAHASTPHHSTHRTTHRLEHSIRYHEKSHHKLRHDVHYVSHTRYSEHQRIEAEFRHSRLQCVPYAREVSHIDITGDAFLWWAKAAGRYARGNTPHVGAVLNFRPIHRMPLGHVAVVTAVLDSRTILVTQANWVPGTITNDVTVQDVSPDNNWTEVRVELGNSSALGSIYPTYGFIYKSAPIETVIARNGGSGNEVAEAPVSRPVAAEAPNRNLQ
ncbi:CHAP domain-containing protein [Acidocella aminolytica]|uniref:CHAP domain-containing protein n=1 Tax=Acidocella aminolytica TaxID=33998 RepID=UPI00091DCA2B|nr:CHAP domain-containing protein [Acidocella aminolytica]GBQ37055.1 hypothetical protein AA11237_1415 [Acidocella aminolytica 101 = DSM 11237]SHE84597.1 CHAP domain-containing protein [Acidocella aminolytica 101 = DSM 11237]